MTAVGTERPIFKRPLSRLVCEDRRRVEQTPLLGELDSSSIETSVRRRILGLIGLAQLTTALDALQFSNCYQRSNTAENCHKW
jgi:hypothetical protein